MIAVYYNYPNSGFSIHEGMSVEQSRVQSKADPKIFFVTVENMAQIINLVKSPDIKFASNQDENDLWLEINFGDVAFEKAFAEYVLRLLGRRYKPFRDVWV